MKTGKLAAIAIAAAMMTAPAAFANDMGNNGMHHHHMMCKPQDGSCHGMMHHKDEASFKKMKELHEKIHAVLTADKFDKKKFMSLSDQMEQLHARMMRHHTEEFADKAAHMSREERTQMAEHFGEMHEGWHQHAMMHHAGSHEHTRIDWQGQGPQDETGTDAGPGSYAHLNR